MVFAYVLGCIYALYGMKNVSYATCVHFHDGKKIPEFVHNLCKDGISIDSLNVDFHGVELYEYAKITFDCLTELIICASELNSLGSTQKTRSFLFFPKCPP